MNSVSAETLQEVARRIRDELRIDPGLDPDIAAVVATESPSKALAKARAALTERMHAIQAGWSQLAGALHALGQLQAVARFTAEGWAEREEELTALLRAHPDQGLVEWLDDWMAAASGMRLDALDRLLGSELPLPAGTALVAERLSTAAKGLAQQSWALSRLALGPGAAGLASSPREMPDRATRADLWILLARLAVRNDVDPEPALAAAADLGAGACAQEAVRAYRARRSGLPADADAAVDRVLESGPTGVDMAVEEVHMAGRRQLPEAALEAARKGIASIGALADLDNHLALLVDDPPAELWLAVAERAEDEGDAALAARALARAEQSASAPDTSYKAKALIYQRRSAAATRDEERVSFLGTEAVNWLWAGEADAAIETYERALAIDAHDRDAQLGLTDALLVRWAGRPMSEARPGIERALALVAAARAEHRIVAETSWNLLVETALRGERARVLGPQRPRELWCSLLAAARSLVYSPLESRRWVALADSADPLGLGELALFAAHRAVEVDAGANNEESAEADLRTRANNAPPEDALLRVAESTEPWASAMLGHVLLRARRPKDALAALRGPASLHPEWLWVQFEVLTALVLVGDHDQAQKEARRLLGALEERADEYDCVVVMAAAALVAGHDDLAIRYGAQLRASSPSRTLEADLMARLLGEDPTSALEEAISTLRASRRPATLDDWTSYVRPVVEALAGRRQTAIPDLDVVTPVVDSRRVELEAERDPVAALRRFAGAVSDVPEMQPASELVTVVVHLARGEGRAARRASDAGCEALRDLPESALLTEQALVAEVQECLRGADAAGALRAELERLLRDGAGGAGESHEVIAAVSSSDQRDAALDQLSLVPGSSNPAVERLRGDVLFVCGQTEAATEAWSVAGETGALEIPVRMALAATKRGDRPAAQLHMRQALDEAPYTVDERLRELGADPGLMMSVRHLLGVIAQDADYRARVESVLFWLDGALQDGARPEKAAPQPPLRLDLPASWFSAYANPLIEDPLFTVHLPELRLRADWDVPRVKVQADEELEPDRYRIFVLDDLVEEGSVDPACRYAFTDAEALLRADLRAVARPYANGLSALHVPPERPLSGLEELMTMSPVEVVVRRVGARAEAHRHRLETTIAAEAGVSGPAATSA